MKNYNDMFKRIALLIAFAGVMAVWAVPAAAQMSDNAVKSYVKEALSSGKSQQEVVKELAARGVTPAQAERIKAEYMDAKKSGLAQSNNLLEERTRISERDTSAAVNELERRLLGSEEETPELKVFGQNVFTNRNLTFAPNSNLATPENYRLGPGDEVIIDIWGTNQNTIRQTISPDGFINITDVGLVYLSGMTVKEADAFMRRKLNTIYSVHGDDAKSEIKLSLGALRTIQVNVMGEVMVPGTYYLPSLSNVYHALYCAGGFAPMGSVRNIELIRDGKSITKIDMYDFIVKGRSADEIDLQEGDIILVPTYDMHVNVTGSVKRPMIYEMTDGETVSDLIYYTGGFTGDAYKRNLNLIRRNGREYQVYTVIEDEFSDFKVMDGDSLTVGAVLDRYENRVEIKGAVYRPGVYQLSERINTVSELIDMADGLKGDAFMNRALIHREREDYSIEVISIDLNNLVGNGQDIELKPNDVLTISSIHDLKQVGFVYVYGEVPNPGVYVFAENTTIEDIVIQAGGLLESASTVKVDVSRRIKDPTSVHSTDTLNRTYTFALKDGFIIDGDEDFVLEPHDNVYIRKSPSYNLQHHVMLVGEVLFPGVYSLPHKSTRLSDLIRLAGGLSDHAYLAGARLSRLVGEDEKSRSEATFEMLDSVQDSISVDILENDESRYFVGIDLRKALDNPGSDADVILKHGDEIHIPELVNTVKISGNVLYPNAVAYSPDMKVKDYIDMAGGFGFSAKRSRAYIVYMNGTVAKVRKLSRKQVEPGCEIIVPEKLRNEEALSKILSIATTSSSIATMIATIGNIIK